MNLDIDINSIEELRRDAYVTSIYAKMENDNIVGVFANESDALLIGYGFIPVPIVGVDSYIFEFSNLNNICDPINSTLTYLKTKKCPLLFSSKFFVVDNYCDKFNKSLRENTSRDVIDEDQLANYLKENFSQNYDKNAYAIAKEKLQKIDSILSKLEKTDIKGNLLFKLKFYTRFINNLDDRISFLNKIAKDYKDFDNNRQIIKASCPFAISDVIDRKTQSNYKIKSSKSPQYTYRNCIYEGQEYITYKEI